MYELKKKLERYLQVNLLGPGPRLIKKKNRAAVSQRLRNTVLDDLLKDEERFWRDFSMSSDTFKYIFGLIHTSIKKQNTNFRRSISPEERLMVILR